LELKVVLDKLKREKDREDEDKVKEIDIMKEQIT
jgi:hypothetical protein